MDAARRRRHQQAGVIRPFVPKTFKLLAEETILPDDYPVNGMYIYIVDNVFTRCWLEGTVGEWKRQAGLKEVRRCKLFDHEGARLGDKVE